MHKQIAMVSRLRRSVIYQPLAAMLAVLLAPSFSWFESTSGIPLGPSARAFQSSAQIVVEGCGTSRGNKIIQNVCVNGTSYDVNGDLTKLEADAVEAYLTEHNLPASEAGLIYSEGRTDLRDAIRGNMLTILLAIISEPAAKRSKDPHATMLYNWLQALVQQNEIAEYTDALAAYHAWQADPCNYVLDPVIAAQYGLSYDGAAACEPASVAAAGPPFVPAAAYFTAVGLEKSYGKPAQTTPDFAALVTATGIGMGEAFAISGGAGVLIAGTAGGLIGAFAQQIFPFATFAGDWLLVDSAAETTPAVAATVAAAAETADAVATLSAFSLAAGPAGIVFICVITAGVGAYEVVENQQNLNDLNDLSNLLAEAENKPPDLYTQFAADTTGLGVTKLDETLVAQTLPDVPSTAALPTHKAGDPVFLITPNGGASAVQSSFNYSDWSGIAWQATTSGGWFDLTCSNDSKKCPQPDSFSASIQYVDWSGVNRTASRFGSNFVVSKSPPAATDKPCPADPNTHVTPATDFTKCSSYVASQIQYTYQGSQYTMELTNIPAFNGPTTIYFTWQGQRQNATVTALGTPAPAISLASGSSLPAGVYFAGSDFLGNGQAQFSFLGFTSGTAGTYPVTLRAQNSNTTTDKTFQIVIAPQLQITSRNNLTVPYGQPVSFLVTTTGYPTPALSISSDLLFPGLSFHDNGDGTATISGSTTTDIGTINSGGCLTLNGQTTCSGITAKSAQGSVTQVFSLIVPDPPQPKVVLPTATFVAGIANTFKVTTTGATTPVAFGFGSNGLSWLSFHDNGDGTGILSGTPPVGTSGTYTFQVNPIPKVNGFIVVLPSLFTLNVSGQPQFINPNEASFTVGDPSSFTIATNQLSGPITEVGALPQGLTFTDNGNGTATISGTPAAGSGGLIGLQVSITSDMGTGTQALNLQVNEAPSFSTGSTTRIVNFYAGQDNKFEVPAGGFPALSNAPVAQSQTTANYVPGIEFQVIGLPADLSYSNMNLAGYNTGTLTVSGNPSSSDAGGHLLTIVATNGVGAPAGEQLILNIEPVPGDVNGDGIVNCADFDLVKASFGLYPGRIGFNPVADLNNDGVVNIDDLAIVARNLPKGTACH